MPVAAFLALLMIALMILFVGRTEIDFRRTLARRARIEARRGRVLRC